MSGEREVKQVERGQLRLRKQKLFSSNIDPSLIGLTPNLHQWNKKEEKDGERGVGEFWPLLKGFCGEGGGRGYLHIYIPLSVFV